MRNQVHLIAYADRLGGTLPALTGLIRTTFASTFGGVHILPFYTPYDGADAGFDPVDHTSVDPRLGSWDDVADLAGTHQVMADLIVNHMSSSSPQFRDVVAHGEASGYRDLFLTMGSVFPDGATEDELTRIYRPRPGLPFTAIRCGDRLRYVWTTFTPQQIDIDVASASGRRYLTDVVDALTHAAVSLVRLDAVGYAVKTPGTSCFMTPHTFAFIADFASEARAGGAEVLVEVHSHYERQLEIARCVDLVYDFALPPLVLHALFTQDAAPLVRWLGIRPDNAVTVLDTHDGIGVIDVGPDQDTEPGRPPRPGLLAPTQIDRLVEEIHVRSAGGSRLATGAAASNLDLYQVNCTFYDAMGRDDRLYLAARTIQFFTPGVPQVYYVGALAGGNDLDLLAATGVGRDVNRHRYTRAEVDAAVRRPVVAAQLALCRLRSTLPAFDGPLDVDVDGSTLTMTRHGRAQAASAQAVIDLATGTTRLSWTVSGVETLCDDVLSSLAGMVDAA